jgi:hypothetical protein
MGVGVSRMAKSDVTNTESASMCLLPLLSERSTLIVLQPSLAANGITVGRNANRSHIVLGSSMRLSRRHANITCIEGQWFIEDLNSINGVFVNDIQCKRHVLKEGDIGRLRFPIERYAWFIKSVSFL